MLDTDTDTIIFLLNYLNPINPGVLDQPLLNLTPIGIQPDMTQFNPT